MKIKGGFYLSNTVEISTAFQLNQSSEQQGIVKVWNNNNNNNCEKNRWIVMINQ